MILNILLILLVIGLITYAVILISNYIQNTSKRRKDARKRKARAKDL
jgi:hypothetical protein